MDSLLNKSITISPKARRITFFIILVIAFLLRIVSIGDNPVALCQDEAVNGYDAFSLGITLNDHHGNTLPAMLQSFDDWASPLLTYITIPFVSLFGLSEITIRLPVALIGLAFVACAYAFVRLFFKSNKAALLIALLAALSPSLIHMSRWAIPPSIVPFFFLLAVGIYLLAVQRDGKKGLFAMIGAGAVSALAVYSYPSQKVIIPLILIAGTIIFFKGNALKHGVMWLSFLFLSSPEYLPSLLDPAKYNMRLNSVYLFTSGENPVTGFLSRYFEYLSPTFLFGRGDNDIMHQVPGFPLLFAFLGLFALFGILSALYQCITREKLFQTSRRFLVFMLLLFLIAPLAASVTIEHSHFLRMIHLVPIMLIFAVMGISVLYHSIPKNFIKNILIALILLLPVLETTDFSFFYSKDYHEMSKYLYQYGIREGIQSLLAHEQEFDRVVVDSKINEPYIFYLFYSKYDPKKVPYAEINKNSRTGGGFLMVDQVGKYEFRNITKEELSSASLIYQVKDQYRDYYYIMSAPNKTLYMVRAY